MFHTRFVTKYLQSLQNQLRHSVVEYVLSSTMFKESLNRFVFRIVLSSMRSIIMIFTCFFIPFTDTFLRFGAEIIVCVCIQNGLNISIPFMFMFENKTSFITEQLLRQMNKQYFWFLCEISVYALIMIISLFIHISNRKVQYIACQQIVLCVIFDFNLFYEVLFGKKRNVEYIDFELIEPVQNETDDNTSITDDEDRVFTIDTKDHQTLHVKIVQNYF